MTTDLLNAESLRRVARWNQHAMGAKLATKAIETGLAVDPHDIQEALDAAMKSLGGGLTPLTEAAEGLNYAWAVKANQPALH